MVRNMSEFSKCLQDRMNIVDYLKNQKLFELSFFINNNCNLKCKHCYVGTKNEEADVDLKRWKFIIDEAISSGIRIIGIVGKEPLLTADKTFELLRFIKQRDKNIITGFVTNGTLLYRYAKEISNLDMNYIDISVEGTEKSHDYIRGNGNFQRTLEGIKSLFKFGFPKDKIFLSITLTSKTDLNEMIEYFDKLGISNYVISPYMQFSHNSKELGINETTFFDTFMRNLDKIKTENNIKLIVKVDYSNLLLLKHFIEKKYIDLENLYQDYERNIVFTEHNKNKISVFFNFLPFNTELTREIRITSDGYVLSCMDQGFPDYKKRSVGNIKENSLNQILKGDICQRKIRTRIKDNINEIKSIFNFSR